MRHLICVFSLAAIVPVLSASRAAAQTPINAPGAMQPSTGTGVLHIMPYYRREGADPQGDQQSANDYVALVQAAYGITSTIGIQFDVPMVYQDISLQDSAGGGRESDFGIADSTLLVKWRVYQHDPAPAETVRFSLIGGLQIPGDSDYTWDASVDAWDPIIGCVFSAVRGRHGFNVDALWEFYTGDDRDQGASDSLRYDASYLFRVSPVEFAADVRSAVYAVVELNGFYDANGDNELFISPGIMYEAHSFTLDASIMLPVWQDLDYRAETEIAVALGLRISF